MEMSRGRSAAAVDGELPGGPYTARVVSPKNVEPMLAAGPGCSKAGDGAGVPSAR
jgi:hypothetical protein